MRRRDVLAGVGSLGVIGSAGVVAIRGLPSVGDGPGGNQKGNPSDRSSANTDPMTIETVEAPGSEAGEVRVPSSEQPTFIDFFGTWCPPCIEQMPALGEANERIGDEVLFISVTNEAVGRSVTEEELVDWWKKHDGNWLLGLDPTAELSARYLAGGYPSAVAIDTSGRVQWEDTGIKTADELVAGIEQAIEASGGD